MLGRCRSRWGRRRKRRRWRPGAKVAPPLSTGTDGGENILLVQFLPCVHDFPFFATFKDVLRMELHCLWKVDYLKNKSTLLMINLKQVTEAGGALVGNRKTRETREIG